MDIGALRDAYSRELHRATRFRLAVIEQIERLLTSKGVTLGVPIESRLKSWESLEEKVSRKGLELTAITDLNDFVGVRTILLFRRDVDVVAGLLSNAFNILSVEDASTRLSETQFGYHSRHFILTLPESWLRVPSLSDLGDLKAEIQVRTLSQHIWAAASHKLQYKQEVSVPPPLRRSIHRVSALLETVDLEFERLLEERKKYVEHTLEELPGSEPLNVDIVAAILAEVFPAQNRKETEAYAELLGELHAFDVNSATSLRHLLKRQLPKVLATEAGQVKRRSEGQSYVGTSKERIDAGVFFAHVGLAREALLNEFGERYKAYKRIRTTKGG